MYTTITELVKNGKRSFLQWAYQTVLSNNKSVGMILSPEMAEALTSSGVLDQVREELWELHDTETQQALSRSERRDFSQSLLLDTFMKKHAV